MLQPGRGAFARNNVSYVARLCDAVPFSYPRVFVSYVRFRVRLENGTRDGRFIGAIIILHCFSPEEEHLCLSETRGEISFPFYALRFYTFGNFLCRYRMQAYNCQ